MSFTVVPFIILSFSGSIHLWSHVYFYGIVGVFTSLAFFHSPGKTFLIKQLNKRNEPQVSQVASQDNSREPTLGLPNDPEKEIEEAMNEIKKEIEARKKGGSIVSMPTGDELNAAIEQKLGKDL